MNTPKISVIIPVFNVEKYIRKCIDSVINQTYKNLEIILVDDGSTDNSPTILDEYEKRDNRIKVVYKENGGVSSARNCGLDLSTGKFIAFVDSDDYIEPTMYEKLANSVLDNDVVFCRFIYDYNDGIEYRYESNLNSIDKRPFDFMLYTKEGQIKKQGDKVISERIFGSVCRELFKKEIIDTNKIRFNTQLKIAEDRLFLLNYLVYCKSGALVDEYLYHYVMTNSLSATTTTFNRYNKNLPQRNELLAKEQIKLVFINNFMKQSEKNNFINTVKLNTVSEVVQNEILYNENYKKNLKIIFKNGFYRKLTDIKTILFAKRTYGIKKAIYFCLIRLRLWGVIKNKIK